MDYNKGMDVEQLRQDVREGRVKLEWLIESLVAQQHKLAEAVTRIREREEALDALRKQSSPTANGGDECSGVTSAVLAQLQPGDGGRGSHTVDGLWP